MCVRRHSVVSHSLQPHGLWPARLPCPWGFSRQEKWSGFPSPPPGDLPNPGTEPQSPALQTESLPSEPLEKPVFTGKSTLSPDFHISMNGATIFLVTQVLGGEGNGNPLQNSCLENPRERGAWRAAVYGVAQSWTRLKRLSSSSRFLEIHTCNIYLTFLGHYSASSQHGILLVNSFKAFNTSALVI